MKKVLLLIGIMLMVVSSSSFADSDQADRARIAFVNLGDDAMQCAVFQKIMTDVTINYYEGKGISKEKKSIDQVARIIGYRNEMVVMAAILYKAGGVSTAAVVAKSGLMLDDQMDQIDGCFCNISILYQKYLKSCAALATEDGFNTQMLKRFAEQNIVPTP